MSESESESESESDGGSGSSARVGAAESEQLLALTDRELALSSLHYMFPCRWRVGNLDGVPVVFAPVSAVASAVRSEVAALRRG